MPTRSESIKKFLQAKTHADLAAMYGKNMECQVNVAQDGGTKIKGDFKGRMWHGWTDGAQTWKSFRIPRNANSDPEDNDGPMTFDIQHAEAVGMTGWDWLNRCSRWVAFDFDEISGHKEVHEKKLDVAELEKVKQAAFEIPWVTVRKSSGGKGLHLYVFMDPPEPTQNHNEHAALARAILGKMSSMTGFDFNTKVDICGHNMWVYHRKIQGVDGLALIKEGEALSQIPLNWKDHLKVITGHRKKTLPKFFKTELQTDDSNLTETERWFLELTSQTTRVPLDEGHKKLINWLETRSKQGWWDSDHHMLVTHTYYLKQAHEEFDFRGIFETTAKGTETDIGDHNCFCFPRRDGGWVVRRYSRGVQEHPSWDQDGAGWTRTYLNVQPDLGTAARAHGGLESPTGGFIFQETELAADAARKLGANIPDLPPGIRGLKATLKTHKDGRLIFEIDGDTNRIADMPGWLHDKQKWKRMFNIQATSSVDVVEVGNYEEVIRHIVTSNGDDYGWVLKSEAKWRNEPLTHIKVALQAMGLNPKDIGNILGSSVMKAWKLVNLPFQAEYPGDRQWNREAAQFKYIPTNNRENLKYDHWTKILTHCGRGLNSALRDSGWAKANFVETGGDYLKIWVASLFKEPLQPLPYLFFYGEQNSGKSIFHEALSLLLTKGYVQADQALVNQQGFNGELANAVLCVVEEVNLSRSKDALSRIKNWVTARELPVHPKGETPYHIPNATHWVQCANDSSFCPTFPGDTRITMSYVEPLEPEQMIAKRELIARLEEEAPDFLAEILGVEIPPSNDRLNVPVIATAEKYEAQKMNQTPLQRFISEECHAIAGRKILYGEFYERFANWVDPAELEVWTKQQVGKSLPAHFPKGRSREDGKHYIGNISFTSLEPDAKILPKLVTWRQEKTGFIFLVPDDDHQKTP